jgi:hypothetical protein
MPERPSSDATFEIVPCTPAHYEAFRRLNYEWIDHYFGVEKVDPRCSTLRAAFSMMAGTFRGADRRPPGRCVRARAREGTFGSRRWR